MTRTLGQLLQEANEVIEKRAGAESGLNKTASSQAQGGNAPDSDDEDIFKLAAEVRRPFTPQVSVQANAGQNKTAAEGEFEFTEEEKIACSMAITETLLSAKEISALLKLEKVATERQIPEEQLQGFFAKVSQASNAGRRVFDFFQGVGDSAQHLINAARVDSSGARAVGQGIGLAVPVGALVGGGAYVGAKAKEHSIKKQLGMA